MDTSKPNPRSVTSPESIDPEQTSARLAQGRAAANTDPAQGSCPHQNQLSSALQGWVAAPRINCCWQPSKEMVTQVKSNTTTVGLEDAPRAMLEYETDTLQWLESPCRCFPCHPSHRQQDQKGCLAEHRGSWTILMLWNMREGEGAREQTFNFLVKQMTAL